MLLIVQKGVISQSALVKNSVKFQKSVLKENFEFGLYCLLPRMSAFVHPGYLLVITGGNHPGQKQLSPSSPESTVCAFHKTGLHQLDKTALHFG